MFSQKEKENALKDNVGRTVSVMSMNISFTGTLIESFIGYKVVSESKSHDTINTVRFSLRQVEWLEIDTDASLIIRIRI